MSHQTTFTAAQATVAVDQDEIEVTNVSFTIETQTSQIQQETSFNPTTAVAGMRYSGSFEYSGINPEIIERAVITTGTGAVTGSRPNITLSIGSDITVESSTTRSDFRGIIFSDVTFTSIDRDLDAADVASTTVQFQADSMREFQL